MVYNELYQHCIVRSQHLIRIININVPKQERQRTHTSRHSRELSKGAWYFRINIVLHESGIAKISEELRGKSLSINFGFGIHLRGEKSSILLNSH